jgi:hypothetical protein
MRGRRLWMAVLLAGTTSASALAQPTPNQSATASEEVIALVRPPPVPTLRPPPPRRELERTNFGWIVLLGLHSLTTPLAAPPPTKPATPP